MNLKDHHKYNKTRNKSWSSKKKFPFIETDFNNKHNQDFSKRVLMRISFQHFVPFRTLPFIRYGYSTKEGFGIRIQFGICVSFWKGSLSKITPRVTYYALHFDKSRAGINLVYFSIFEFVLNVETRTGQLQPVRLRSKILYSKFWNYMRLPVSHVFNFILSLSVFNQGISIQQNNLEGLITAFWNFSNWIF